MEFASGVLIVPKIQKPDDLKNLIRIPNFFPPAAGFYQIKIIIFICNVITNVIIFDKIIVFLSQWCNKV